jgi:hypothetical protein
MCDATAPAAPPPFESSKFAAVCRRVLQDAEPGLRPQLEAAGALLALVGPFLDASVRAVQAELSDAEAEAVGPWGGAEDAENALVTAVLGVLQRNLHTVLLDVVGRAAAASETTAAAAAGRRAGAGARRKVAATAVGGGDSGDGAVGSGGGGGHTDCNRALDKATALVDKYVTVIETHLGAAVGAVARCLAGKPADEQEMLLGYVGDGAVGGVVLEFVACAGQLLALVTGIEVSGGSDDRLARSLRRCIAVAVAQLDGLGAATAPELASAAYDRAQRPLGPPTRCMREWVRQSTHEPSAELAATTVQHMAFDCPGAVWFEVLFDRRTELERHTDKLEFNTSSGSRQAYVTKTSRHVTIVSVSLGLAARSLATLAAKMLLLL